MILLAAASVIAWLYLLCAHGRFWRVAPVLRAAPPGRSVRVAVIVPARDEAETVARALASLTAQRTAAIVDVILVDDESADGTRAIAESVPGVRVLAGATRPPGWSGKLHAVAQGVAAAGDAEWLLLTDADIVHEAGHLDALLHAARDRIMVSGMVMLRAEARAERWLVPAFVYFFAMLFPFARVADPRSGVAAAAGGTVLIRADALARMGGIAAIRGALIDDVALAAVAKRFGPVALFHDPLARSLRAYPHAADLWRMIARTAFTQLRYSGWRLAASLAGLALLFWIPVIAAASGGVIAWGLMALTFAPMLRHYRLSPLRALALPAIATFFMAATLGSALDHWRGRGVRWRARAYVSEAA